LQEAVIAVKIMIMIKYDNFFMVSR
jgi:hypothetical protein